MLVALGASDAVEGAVLFCSALNAAICDEQLKADPVPASACWMGCRKDSPPVAGSSCRRG